LLSFTGINIQSLALRLQSCCWGWAAGKWHW